MIRALITDVLIAARGGALKVRVAVPGHAPVLSTQPVTMDA